MDYEHLLEHLRTKYGNSLEVMDPQARWMVDFMDTPQIKWMMTGGTTTSGKLHVVMVDPTMYVFFSRDFLKYIYIDR